MTDVGLLQDADFRARVDRLTHHYADAIAFDAERVAALAMIEPRADRPRAITLGADKAYDAEDFVNELRSMTVTPHVAQNTALIHVN